MSLLSFTKKIVGQDKTKAASGAKASAKTAETKTKNMMSIMAGQINLTPLVTEKTVATQGGANTVAFRVHLSATKGQVAAAILERYKITPRKIRSMHMQPKQRRRGATTGTTSRWKKVYVTLPAGKTIDVSV